MTPAKVTKPWPEAVDLYALEDACLRMVKATARRDDIGRQIAGLNVAFEAAELDLAKALGDVLAITVAAEPTP